MPCRLTAVSSSVDAIKTTGFPTDSIDMNLFLGAIAEKSSEIRIKAV